MMNHHQPLGPFQDIWDAWSDVAERVMQQPANHFAAAILTQLEEAAEESFETRGKEVLDVISVSLNWLRWLGYSPADIAELAHWRAATRYQTKGDAIFEKYKGIMKAEDIV